MPEFLTVDEVAEIFRLKNKRTIYTWIKNGVFPNAVERGGYLIPRKDVDELIEQSKVSKVCPPPQFVKTPLTVRKTADKGFVNRWKP